MAAAVYNSFLLRSPECLSNYRHPSVSRSNTDLQTDDALHIGTRPSLFKEEHSSKRFACEPKVVSVDVQNIEFTGDTIFFKKDIVKLHQPTHVKAFQKIDSNNANKSRFIFLSAREEYTSHQYAVPTLHLDLPLDYKL